VSANLVGLTLGTSLHVACNKSFHTGPVDILFGQLVSSKLSWMTSCWKIVMHLYSFAPKFMVVGNVKTSFEGEYVVLVIAFSEGVLDSRVV
jgi:hypothetical protein